MDQSKFQAQRETWLKAYAAVIAAVSRRDSARAALDHDVERAEAREREERAKLEAMHQDARNAADGFLRDPSPDEIERALTGIGERKASPAPAKPDPVQGAPVEPHPLQEGAGVFTECSHANGRWFDEPAGTYRCTLCNEPMDSPLAPLAQAPVN